MVDCTHSRRKPLLVWRKIFVLLEDPIPMVDSGSSYDFRGNGVREHAMVNSHPTTLHALIHPTSEELLAEPFHCLLLQLYCCVGELVQYALLNFPDARVEAWCTLHLIKLYPRALSPTNIRNPLRGVDAASKCRGGPHARARLYESRLRFYDPFFFCVLFLWSIICGYHPVYPVTSTNRTPHPRTSRS